MRHHSESLVPGLFGPVRVRRRKPVGQRRPRRITGDQLFAWLKGPFWRTKPGRKS